MADVDDEDVSELYSKPVFVSLYKQTSHSKCGNYAQLFHFVNGVLLEYKYCSLCIKDRKKEDCEILYSWCPLCNIPVSLINEGFHVWCSECNTCSGSGVSHSFSHKPGQCKACTESYTFDSWCSHKPGDCKVCTCTEGDTLHSWCNICKSCDSFASQHHHVHSHVKKWTHRYYSDNCEIFTVPDRKRDHTGLLRCAGNKTVV